MAAAMDVDEDAPLTSGSDKSGSKKRFEVKKASHTAFLCIASYPVITLRNNRQFVLEFFVSSCRSDFRPDKNTK